jgi:hypothetical protein
MLALAGAAEAQQTPRRADARVAHSRDSLPSIETSVIVSASGLSRGERIDLTVTAANRGSQRVQVAIPCGPSLDILVQYPDGSERSALWDSVEPNGAFTCIGRPSGFENPGQTETERVLWRVPDSPGIYRLGRRSDGMTDSVT